MVVIEQVRQIGLHGSQVFVELFMMKVPVVQVVPQAVPERKNPEAQVMQEVWPVQVAQGLTQAVQVVGLIAVSGWFVAPQSATQICALPLRMLR